MQQPIGGGENAARDSRHIELHHVVQHLYNVIQTGENLVDKIKGPHEKGKPEIGDTATLDKEPTLQQVLVQSPKKLKIIADRLTKIFEEIEESIF